MHWFGLEPPKSPRFHFIQVPWDATASYGKGAHRGAEAMREASQQLDSSDAELQPFLHLGLSVGKIHEEVETLNQEANHLSKEISSQLDQIDWTPRLKEAANKVNLLSERVNSLVREEASLAMKRNQLPIVLGGDHSSPLGLLQALDQSIGEEEDTFGIVHVDAHFDLREAYQGFEFSHASIMFNALKLPRLTSLTQIGIRDFCEEEAQIAETDSRIVPFYDRFIQTEKIMGIPFSKQVEKMTAHLPKKIYLSIDIDGLDPTLCPSTGTPVPGGLSFSELVFLVKHVASRSQVVGFDLCEVSKGPTDWDANVGMRVLAQLMGWSAFSRGWTDLRSTPRGKGSDSPLVDSVSL